MNYAKSVKEDQQHFWAKNQKLNRPLSPHLTIYRFVFREQDFEKIFKILIYFSNRLPLPAILSVTHRATGAALSGC